MSLPEEAAIAVVGAGPVGLVAAIGLARRGIPVVVVESSSGLRLEGSKAICVQREPLETLSRHGAADDLLIRGVSWTVGRTYFRDHELQRIDLPSTGPDALPPFINISQYEVEQELLKRLTSLPQATVLWSHRLVGLEQDDSGVTLRVERDGRKAELRSHYVIAADGGRSTIRKLLGVEFPGYSSSDAFLIADVQAELPFAHERRFFFDPAFNRGRQVLIHPQPDSVWRIDWQVPPGVDADEERRTGRMDARIRSVVGDVDYELLWLSTYQFHQRCADRFRVGRVFLSGDAAHLMAPFGARGMNSGIADADNLTWKLDLVLSSHVPASLLDSYEGERRAAALENLRVTGATMRFLVPPSTRERLRRQLVLRGSRVLRGLRRYVDSGRLSTPHVYEASPLIASGGSGLVGAVAPDAPCHVPGRPEVRRLRELLGDDITALYLAPNVAAAQRVLTGQWTQPDCPHRVCVVLPKDLRSGDTRDTLLVIDTTGAIVSAYGGTDLLFVVRPDLHLASMRRNPGPDDWATVAQAALGRDTVEGM